MISIAAYHARLLEDHDIDYRVFTVGAAGDIERLSHEQFGALGVGSASRSGRGLLLVIDPAGDRVRLEVAAALEAIYTDGFVAYLQHRQMVPFFEAGRVADGILATTELIFARAQEAAAGQAFDAVTAKPFSLGGGASTAARLRQGREQITTPAGQVAPGATPEATVAAYLAAMGARNASADLALYSRDTRATLGSWTITPAQMDQIARAYGNCAGPVTRLGPGDRRAVVRYPGRGAPVRPLVPGARGRPVAARSREQPTGDPLQPSERMAPDRPRGLRLRLRGLALRPQRVSDRRPLSRETVKARRKRRRYRSTLPIADYVILALGSRQTGHPG